MQAINIVVQAPRTIQICSAEVAAPEAGEVRLTSRISAISPGTEMLFYRGEAPDDQPVDSTIAVHGGALAYPLHYGYATVATVDSIGAEVDPAWLKRRVFAFQPHASAFLAKPELLLPIPVVYADRIDDARAALFANTETAVNLAQDGAPIVGERILIFGLGIVGLLTAAVLARVPGVEVVAIDPLANRRAAAGALGIHTVASPDEEIELKDFDLVYELTGRPQTLSAAVAAAGYGGRVVVGSWYGSKRAPIVLDTHFHRNRIRIVSSQVSTIAPELSGRWDKTRRYNLVWQLLADLPLDALVTHTYPAAEAADAFRMVDEHPEESIQVLLDYTL